MEKEDEPVDLSKIFEESLKDGAASVGAMSVLSSAHSTLTEKVTKLQKAKTTPKTTDGIGKSDKRITELPGGRDGVPSARSRTSWIRTKFGPWAPLQTPEFDFYIMAGLQQNCPKPVRPDDYSKNSKEKYERG